jgi:hypothetical protein
MHCVFFSWLTAARRWAVLTGVGLALSVPAAAHEGHGLSAPSHWHATDAWMVVAVAAAVLLMVMGRKK